MSISLTDKYKRILLDVCQKLTSGERHKIRTMASAVDCRLSVVGYRLSVVGCIIAALPGVKYYFTATWKVVNMLL